MSKSAVTIKVVREISRSALLGGPMRAFLEDAMIEFVGIAQTPGNVPIWNKNAYPGNTSKSRGGTLADSLNPGGGTSEVDRSDPPTWARVGTNLDYGLALDQPSTRDPHYRSGPSKGQPTEGWLTDKSRQAFEREALDGLLAELARDIEEAWRRG